MHTGKDVAICKEIQRPVRAWAKARREDYKVTEVNGQEQIERLSDGSRWMIRAKEAVYGYACSVAAVDEAWKVKAATIEDGLTPTMVERVQPQLWLVSTAHRLATELMLERRRVALAGLEEGDGDLLIEWSAPADAKLEDVDAWRLASPHWTPKRERLISKRLQAARLGEVDPAAEEPDPEQSFRSQWLNQWPGRNRRCRRRGPKTCSRPGSGSRSKNRGPRLRAADRRARGRLRARGGGRRGLAPGGREDRGRRLADGGLGLRDRRCRAPAHLAPGLGALRRRLPARPDAEGGIRAAAGGDDGGAGGPGRLPRPGRDGDARPRGDARAGHGDRADAGPRIARGPGRRRRPLAPDQGRRLGRARRAPPGAGLRHSLRVHSVLVPSSDQYAMIVPGAE